MMVNTKMDAKLKIGLFNIDSKRIPNYALCKVEKYYTDLGYEIIWNDKKRIDECSEIFVSCIFTKNKHECNFFENLIPKMPHVKINIGGSGYDIYKELPPEIENIKIHQNFGFTMRGCVRNCEFCIVPKKEGKLKIVADIYDIWDGKSNQITLMDNNIFANKEHFFNITNQLIKNNLQIDFNQGLDIRLLDDELAQQLVKLKPISSWRFSFDSLKYKTAFLRGAEILKKYKLAYKSQFFLLVGFDSTVQEDVERIRLLNQYKLNSFFMLFEKGKYIKGELSEEDKLVIGKLRCPIGNKLKYLRILELNNKNINNEIVTKVPIIKSKKLF